MIDIGSVGEKVETHEGKNGHDQHPEDDEVSDLVDSYKDGDNDSSQIFKVSFGNQNTDDS